jgi:small-conductance mechanosensitive channel
VPVSVVFTVVAFYRDDDLLPAAVLVCLLTGVGSIASQALVSIAITRSLGPTLLVFGVLQFGLLLRLLIGVPLLISVLWLARKLRRWLAPDTLDDERLSAA